ncbi:MAG: hypothetical protein IJ168_02005 [Eubacterium sp.]|nr:hypothetical protein [Eubacterium sp.]
MKEQQVLKTNHICLIRYSGLLVKRTLNYGDDSYSNISIIPAGSIVRLVDIKQTNDKQRYRITLEDASGKTATALQDTLVIKKCPMIPLIKDSMTEISAKQARRCQRRLWYYCNWKNGKSIELKDYSKSKSELKHFINKEDNND